MKNSNYSLFIEINDLNYIFFVGDIDEQNNLKLIHKLEVPLQGIKDNRISDLDSAFKVIKENIFIIEQKFNFTFKEAVLVLENFRPSFINFTGYKKLNGSQVLRENITYILNTLKSCIDKIELKKKFYTSLIQNLVWIIKKLTIYRLDFLETFIHMNYLLH